MPHSYHMGVGKHVLGGEGFGAGDIETVFSSLRMALRVDM